MSEKAKEYVPSHLKLGNDDTNRFFEHGNSENELKMTCLHLPKSFLSKGDENFPRNLAIDVNNSQFNSEFNSVSPPNINNADIFKEKGLSIDTDLLQHNKEPTKLSLDNANKYVYKSTLNKNY